MAHSLLPAVIPVALLALVFLFAWISDLRAMRQRQLAEADERARKRMGSAESGRMMRSITAPTASKAVEIWLSQER